MKPIFCLLIFLKSVCVLYGAEIPIGQDFNSPDGRYTVCLAGNDDEHFVIKDKITGTKDGSIEMPTVLLFLQWCTNSKSFITVEHIANGSYGRIVYLQDGKWCSANIEPPVDGVASSSVIKISEVKDRVNFIFVARLEKNNGETIRYETCHVEVGSNSGKILATKQTPISEEDAKVLLQKKPDYHL